MSVLTLESLADAFAKKDAEIERLKKSLYEHQSANAALYLRIDKQAELITELCDALEDTSFDVELLQRAREATR